MPSKTAKQARFFAAMCNNPAARKRRGVSKKVACEYHRHDRKLGKIKPKKRA